MDQTFSQILKEKVHSDILFFRNWYDFHFNVEKYLPKEAYKDITGKYPDNVFNALMKCPSKRVFFKKAILSACSLNSEVDYNVSAENFLYAMLPPELIKRLIIVLGALVSFQDIAKIIGRKQLESIRNFIGNDVYLFVIKRSLLFSRRIPSFKEYYSHLPLEERIPLLGQRVLEYVMYNFPRSVIDRLNLRTGMSFNIDKDVSEKEFSQSINLVKYAITNFFANDEGAKLCLK